MVKPVVGSGFSMPNLPQVQKLLSISPELAAQGMYRGTRRVLAGFRKDWLKSTPVHIKGKGAKGAGNTRSGRNVGSTFIWSMTPRNESQVKKVSQIDGQISTHSFAAHGLEIGGTVKGRDGGNLAIPITGLDALHRKVNTKANGRVKGRWKTVRRALDQKTWQFKLIDKGSHQVILTRKKMTKKAMKDSSNRKIGAKERRPWCPIFRLVKSVTLKPGRLRFFYTWEKLQKVSLRRFEKELDAKLATRWKRGKGRR